MHANKSNLKETVLLKYYHAISIGKTKHAGKEVYSRIAHLP